MEIGSIVLARPENAAIGLLPPQRGVLRAIRPKEDSDKNYLVEFDPPFKGHSGNIAGYHLDSDRGWWVRKEDIVKILSSFAVDEGYKEYQLIMAAQELMGE